MKKLFYTLGIIAASAIAFTSCQKEKSIDNNNDGKLVTVTFSAEKAGTKTAAVIDDVNNTVSYIWTDEDVANIKLFTVTKTKNDKNEEVESLTEVANPTVTKVSDTKLTISGQVAPNKTYTFRAILCDPKSYTGSGDYSTRKPKVKNTQAPNGTNNYDPTADILISVDQTVTVGESTEATVATEALEMSFRRQVVITKMTLKNLTPGEKVNRVVVTSSTNDITGYFSNGDYTGQGKVITLNYDDVVVPSNGEFPVYFASMNNTGIALTIDVTTDQFTYTKSFAEGKTIDLNLGSFVRFNVPLPAGTPVVAFTDGMYFITGVKSDKVYAAKKYNSGDNNLSKVEITLDVAGQSISGEGLDDCVFIFTTVSGLTGDKAKYNGKYTIKDAGGQYLYAPNTTSNHLKGEAAPDGDGNAYWDVSVNSDGSFLIKTVRDSNKKEMRFNESSVLFSCYASGQKAITLYPASWCSDITTDPVISFDDSEKTKDVTATATSVEFNYTTNNFVTTDPTVTIASDPKGIINGTPTIENKKITVSLNTNTESVAKTATLTVSGTGLAEPVTLTINQAAAVDAQQLPYTESFTSNQGLFTINNVVSPGFDVWKHDSSNKYMKATAYASGTNNASESWLVSPVIQIPDLSSNETVKLSFSQCVNKYFGTIADEATLWVKTSTDTDWTQIDITYPTVASGKTFSSFEDQEVNLTSYSGKKIQFAFKYVSTSTTAGTWEIKNVDVKKIVKHAVTFSQPTETGCSFTVSVDNNAITSGTEVEEGKTVALSATVGQGYKFSSWTVTGATVSGNTANASFTMGTSDVSVSASFTEDSGKKDYYKLVTSVDDITAGTYVVGALRSTSASNNFYFGKATVSSGDWVVSDNYVTVAEDNGVRRFEVNNLPTGAVEFTLTGDNTNGFLISNGTNYLYYTASSNRKLAFAAAGSSQKWTVSSVGDAFITGGVALKAVTTSGNYTISENSTATGAIRGYASTTVYRAIYLFKKVTE